MSWITSQAEAESIYRELRKRYEIGGVRIILRALERQLNKEQKAINAANANATSKEHSANPKPAEE